MKTAEILRKKIDDLPESELEILTQELLVKRYEAYKENKDRLSKSVQSWNDEMQEKYGWNE
ncbi:MAG: hypothetical protein KKG00_17665 [Bacteroidetes bacterium]|nr:hypothetical protein [Bacteroidota bacterium]